jgi:predicted ATP-grasp superfamily ATP-dependent carboligase
VYGFDYKKDIGSYSKYIKFSLCPNPIKDECGFVQYVIDIAKSFEHKPVLYIAADDFLEAFSKNRVVLQKYLLMNIPDTETLKLAFDKNLLYDKVKSLGIDCPKTYTDSANYSFPLIIKAKNVNDWRNKISSNDKVIIINNRNELEHHCKKLDELDIGYVLQEIVPGNDDRFFKYNTYIGKNGEILAEFMLQKLRQNPVRYGVGSLVKSIYDEEIRDLGRAVFGMIGYKGVGSVEFKYDERDNKYKLIEINSRYWQQNILPTKCGINFPFIEYLYLTNSINYKYCTNYDKGIKWINIYMDFTSFLNYRKEGKIGLMDWVDEIKGEKVYSDFAGDDIIPGFYELFLSKKLNRLPKYFSRNI